MKKVFSFLGVESMIINSDQQHMVGGWQWKSERMKKLMMHPNILKTIIKYILPVKRFKNSNLEISTKRKHSKSRKNKS